MRFHVLYNLIKSNNYKTFLELGVERGITSKFLLDNIPELEITCIDPYEIYPGSYGGFHGDKDEMEKFYKMAYDNVFSNPRCKFYRMHSVEAIKLFIPESFDIIFIDANHYYDWVKKDIDLWWPIVKKGGILSGHDYIKKNNWGVKQAVNEFVKNNNLIVKTSKDNVWYIKK